MSSSSSSSSSSIGNLQTSSLLRLTGTNLMSGLDTDSIIKALTSRTQSKIDKQKQLEQIAEWKRDMYRDVSTSLKTFSNTYFSYTNSSTNILSSSFFNNTTITSSSSAVTATGSAANAKNITINSISQLASAAAYNSNQKVSSEAITSGKIYDSWTKSDVGGRSVTVTYGGQDYTLTLSNSVVLDSHDTDAQGKLASSEVQKITDGLNDQINANTDLKGNLAFSYNTSTGIISLKATDSTKNVGIKAFQSDKDDTTDPAFFSQLGFTGAMSGANSLSAANSVNRILSDHSATSLFSYGIPSTSQLTFSYGSENFTLNLGVNLNLKGVTDPARVLGSLANQLNDQINSTSDTSPYKDIKGKVSFAVAGNNITINNSGDQTLTITGSSENIQKGLGLSTLPIAAHGSSSAPAHDADISALTTTYMGDALQGSTLTFSLDGLQKSITFGFDESQYDDPNGNIVNGVNGDGLAKLKTYLQAQIDSSFGTNSDGTKKISVDLDTTPDGHINGQLSFKVKDPSSVLSVNSSDTLNVLNKNGALRIDSNSTNRIEIGETLQDLMNDAGGLGDFAQKLQAGSDGTYKITVNGQAFSFSGTDTIGDIMTKINDNAAAGVTVSYSQTTDTLRIVSSETGSQGKTNFSDVLGGGNLAEVLFGVGTSSLTDPKTGSISTDPTGKVPDTDASTYTINGQSITIANPGSGYFNSISDLGTAVQAAINANSTLKNKITVGTEGNHLTFSSTDGSALTITHDSASPGDVLNVGSGIGTLNTSLSLSALEANSNGRITVSGSNYYVAGSNVAYTGDTLLSTVLNSMNGQDLKMSVCLNGSNSPTDITRSSNSFTLDGVTITANKKTAGTDPPITFSSNSSTDDLYKKISDFVTAYNAVISKVNTYTSDTPERDSDHKLKYQPLTDDQKKDMTKDEIDKWETEAKKGLLQNDNTMNGILSDLDEVMNSTETSSGLSMWQIGISTPASDYDTGGKLSIDDKTLKSMLSTDPDRVQELFTNATDGISTKLSNLLDKYAGTSGGNGELINMAGTDTTVNDQSEMSTEINQYGKNISDLKDQLQTEQDHWWSKFTSMEQSLSRMNAQMGYLSQMSGSSSSS